MFLNAAQSYLALSVMAGMHAVEGRARVLEFGDVIVQDNSDGSVSSFDKGFVVVNIANPKRREIYQTIGAMARAYGYAVLRLHHDDGRIGVLVVDNTIPQAEVMANIHNATEGSCKRLEMLS